MVQESEGDRESQISRSGAQECVYSKPDIKEDLNFEVVDL